MIDVTTADLKAVCAAGFSVSVKNIESGRSEMAAVNARHMASWLMYWILHMDCAAIGRELGDRDPSTVWRAIRQINGRLGYDD